MTSGYDEMHLDDMEVLTEETQVTEIEGYFYAPADGKYKFYIKGNACGKLFVAAGVDSSNAVSYTQ